MAEELSPEARELNLVGKVEMRIALAESDTRLEGLLKTYLTPLLLKLSSEHVSVRNKVIGVCQHVNRRLKLSTEISLPIQPLLKQFGESNSSLVKQFDMIYIQQGLERLPTEEGITILPDLLKMCTPTANSSDLQATEGKPWSLAFQFLLRLLPSWKLPERDSKDDDALKERLGLSDRLSTMLAFWLGKFLLYDSKATNGLNPAETGVSPASVRISNGLTATEMEFLSKFDQVSPSSLSRTRLSDTKAAVGRFLFTKAFSDDQRFIPAVILSSDTTNLTAFRTGDTMFKQCNFDLENEFQVTALFDLYKKARPRLQIRILALLTKSKHATSQTSDILHLIDSQLSSGSEGLEATKLRAAIFQFLNWTVRIGTDNDLNLIAPRAQASLKEYIEEQGWPNPIDVTGLSLSGADIDLRSKAYESIGILANKVPPGFELVKWLFTSLRCDLSGSQMHVSVEEALGRVLNVLTVDNEDTQKNLRALLLWNVTANIGDEDPQDGYKTRRNTRFASVRYANKCLPFADIDARYIDLLAIGSTGERQEIIEEGMRGLDPHWYQMNTRTFTRESKDSDTVVVFPAFEPLVDRIFGAESSHLQEPTGQHLSIFAMAVVFCRNILFRQALEGTTSSIPTESDYERKIEAVVANKEEARSAVRSHLREVDRRALNRLIEAAIIGMALKLGKCAEVAVDLCSMAQNDVLADILDTGLIWARRGLGGNNMKTQDQAARVFGILASHPDHKGVTRTLESLSTAFQGWEKAIGSQVDQIRGSILGYAFTLSRLVLRNATTSYTERIADFSRVVLDIIDKSRDFALREAATTAIGQLALCLPDSQHLRWNSSAIVDSLIPDAKKESERSVSTLGRLVRLISSDDDNNELVTKTLEKLYALQDVKKAELHFAIGETLAVAACGWHSDSTITEFDVDAAAPSRAVDKGLLSKIMNKVVADCKTTKPSLKKAAAIWLLCLIQYCGSEEFILSQLRQCQAAFARLLSDRDEVVQETGSRGLSLVYEMGDKNLKDDLVRDLVGSFTGTNAKVSGTVNEETQLFEAGALPTEGGNSVTTYKDIVSLAQEMGDPSLVYRFMNLAANNAIWTSRAAFGRFGLGTVLADSSYLAENKKFYPKLYRYRFDPNPNVQRSMNEIWRALVKDPNKVIDENFDLILEDLLKTILGKEWRSREASCAAIGDLVQGREVEKYEKYLNDIWGVAFKVLDDIKETVRVAAMTLCRTLTNLLIRNLEVGEGTNKRARTLLQYAMPFLLQQLETGSAKEVQQYAIITLLEVVKKSPPRSLKPFAPVILETLINSLSSLEHESINYLHLNADKYGLTAEKLDKMRVSSINASPVTEAIERCLESLDAGSPDTVSEDTTYVNEAMSKLEGTFKTAIGLPSRVGLSRVVVTLVVRHNLLFRPYADRFAQLLRKNLLDRNETISVAFSMSLAYLMRLVSEKQVQETSNFIRKLYFTSEEPSHRVVSGEILHAISKVSNDVFMRHATALLPLAFVGRSDTDTTVRERFEESWKENVGGNRAINLYLSEIVELVTNNIKSTKWSVRHACCLATADMVSSGDASEQYTAAQAELLWPIVEEALSGKTWEGKEKVILAYPKFVAKATCIWQSKRTEIKKIALREARRTNVTYRPHAVEALGEFALLWKGLDASITTEAMSTLTNLVEELTADDAEDHMEVDAGEESGTHASKNVVETTISAVATCVFRILPATDNANTPAEIFDEALAIIRTVQSAGRQSSRIALYTAAREYFEHVHPPVPGSRMSAGSAATGSKAEGYENYGGKVSMSEGVETFSTAVVVEILQLGLIDADNENTRRARIQTVLAFVRQSPSAKLVQLGARGKISTILKQWKLSERSRPVAKDLEEALHANQQALDRAG